MMEQLAARQERAHDRLYRFLQNFLGTTRERANDEGLKRCPLEPNSKMMAVEARHQERADTLQYL